ncbi:ribonuclease D [Paenibacillus sp. B-A-8]|uniref:ribonuclease D n=1 Tax=Paenibacillus sp. B-A-8 TaxID=3400419 RepID=UPI003B01504C
MMISKENIYVCKGDISEEDVKRIKIECEYIGIDTETTGLSSLTNNLSLVQIAAEGKYYIVQIDNQIRPDNLVKVFETSGLKKVFHHAPFDLSFIMQHLKIETINNVICTKIAYKLINGLGVKSSLEDLTRECLNISLDKSQRMSDWSKSTLNSNQIQYALNDVRYLVVLWKILEQQLIKLNMIVTAKKCFEFLPTQAYLKNKGVEDIFKY